jgi:hypothetical protein
VGLFGPSKDKVWRQFSEAIEAEFVDGSFFKGSKVQVHVEPWTITLDTYTVSAGGHSHITYTRIRAPFLNPEGFRFTIYRASLFSGLGKLFGMQNIELGDPEFDRAFIVKSNDEPRVIGLLADLKIRELIQSQPKFLLDVRDNEGWFGPAFPPDADELRFQVVGIIKDLERLKALVELFAAMLDRLCLIGSAYKQEPGVML